MDRKLSVEDKKWRADSDAETMARYEEIMGDAERRRMAISAAKAKAADMNKRAAAMTRVAGTKSSGSKPSAKPRKK